MDGPPNVDRRLGDAVKIAPKMDLLPFETPGWPEFFLQLDHLQELLLKMSAKYLPNFSSTL
jgi:hypothetical protein